MKKLVRIIKSRVFLIIIIISLLVGNILMESLNPTDNDLVKQIKDNRDTIQQVTTAPQAYQGDWISLNPSELSYSDANTITIAGFTPSDKFSIGDRLRLKQGGGFKYFFVYRVLSSTIKISGGDDYTFTNSAITEPAYSKLIAPTGFPYQFTFTPTASAGGSMTIALSGNETQEVTMIGNMVVVYTFVEGELGGTASGVVYASLPFWDSTTDQLLFLDNSMIASATDYSLFVSGGFFTTYLTAAKDASGNNDLVIRKLDETNFTVSPGGTTNDFQSYSTIRYLILN